MSKKCGPKAKKGLFLVATTFFRRGNFHGIQFIFQMGFKGFEILTNIDVYSFPYLCIDVNFVLFIVLPVGSRG